MNKIIRMTQTKWSVVAVFVTIYIFMLLMNFLTPYVADDFVYRISFYDKQPLETIRDVIHSMYVHSYAMNGRVLSHGLEQLFMLLPKAIFNFFNAAVYCCLIFLIYHIANRRKTHNAFLFIAVAMAFWVFTPAFGQVALWQVGSLNYLWGLTLGIVFLFPFISEYQSPGNAVSKRKKILFSIMAVPIGMYIEISSFIALLLSGILLFLIIFRSKSLKSWLWIPLLLGCVGYLLLLSMPAEINAKTGDMNLGILWQNFISITMLLRTYLLPLSITWMVLLILAIYCKISRQRLVLSVLFSFGALAASYMLMIAAYIPERTLYTSVALLILSCSILLVALLEEPEKVICFCGILTLTMVFAFSLVKGTNDIWNTHLDFSVRETMIEEAKSEGETELLLPCIQANTMYSAFWDLTDLNTTTTDTWPNTQMAQYYGLTSILGY